MVRSLWHYTCDHGRQALGQSGTLLPISLLDKDARDKLPDYLKMLAAVIWFTDLAVPQVEALGLTMNTISCDRTKYRYRAISTYSIGRYTSARPSWVWNKQLCAELEGVPGAKPEHWWIAYGPIPVIYDPIKQPIRRSA
jgi:hypothetical protein